MNLLLWILFGALVGWIASLVTSGLTTRQAEMMTILGVIAGIIGGWIANITCNTALNDFNIYSVLSAVLTACLSSWYYCRQIVSRK